VYKPPDELLPEPVMAAAQPLADDSTGTTTVTSESCCYQPSATFIHVANIANFDLGFHTDDDELNISATLFE